jgi:hypothetical protein
MMPLKEHNMNTKDVFNMESKRRTGRTTRMLIQALKYASEGKKVLVIGANMVMTKNLENQVQQLNYFPNKIKFMSLHEALNFRVFEFNFPTLDYDEVLIDHYAIESSTTFKKMLWEMNRFDAP